MDSLHLIGILLLIAGIALGSLFGLHYLLRLLWKFIILPALNKRLGKINIKYIELVLFNKFQYYQRLSINEKTKFLNRVEAFLLAKEFTSRQDLELTDDMKILISASAIQLTFGLEEYLLANFPKIIVYPKAYYSTISKEYHKGEVSLSGVIVLSWEHFDEGYKTSNDNYNLGLHEMAHALRFEKFKGDEYDEFFVAYFDKWQTVAQAEFLRVKRHQPSIIREYGGANINEFFSVCVEHFFESPKEFKQQLPEIYKHLTILLNQDPLEHYESMNIATLYSSQNSDDFQLKEPILFQSDTGLRVSQTFVYFIFISAMSIYGAASNNETGLLLFFITIIIIIGAFVFNAAYKRFIIYSNGITLRYPIPKILKPVNTFSFEQLICVEFHERSDGGESDFIEITYLQKGRIKTSNFSAHIHYNEIQNIADLLIEKKVAVKLNSFNRYIRKD